jgi:preprotein translocase subunit SecA
VEQQRRDLADWREELLTTGAAADLVRERRPELAEADQEQLVRIAREVALHQLDQAWAGHLAFLAEVREGVHLRALGRLDPLDEFHRAAVPAYGELRESVERSIVDTVAEAGITADWRPEDARLLRPSATWTYLVTDNPFGSELERLISSVSRRTR